MVSRACKFLVPGNMVAAVGSGVMLRSAFSGPEKIAVGRWLHQKTRLAGEAIQYFCTRLSHDTGQASENLEERVRDVNRSTLSNVSEVRKPTGSQAAKQ